MARVWQVLLFLFAFGLSFVLLFSAETLMSGMSRSVWLIPAVVLAATLLLGFLPSFRPPESKVSFFLMYGSAFAMAYIGSVWEVRTSLADAAGRMVIPLLLVVLVICLGVFASGFARSVARRWLIVAVVLGVLLAYFSGSTGGTGGGAWERWLMSNLGVSLGVAEWMVFALRKSVHFVFYGVMAWVAIRAARADGLNRQGAVLFAVLFALAHAAFDETRQAMTPDRSGRWTDVLIDLAGAWVFAKLGSRAKAPERVSTQT